MPGCKMRKIVGDKEELTIIFEGPSGIANKKLDCVLVLSPCAAPPKGWQLACPPQKDKTGKLIDAKPFSDKHKCKIGSGRPVRELLCAQLVDQFGNVCPLSELVPELITLGNNPITLEGGGGVWERKGDHFLPPLAMMLTGAVPPDAFNILVKTGGPVGAADAVGQGGRAGGVQQKIGAFKQQVLLEAGGPAGMKVSYKPEVKAEGGGAGAEKRELTDGDELPGKPSALNPKPQTLNPQP